MCITDITAVIITIIYSSHLLVNIKNIGFFLKVNTQIKLVQKGKQLSSAVHTDTHKYVSK